MKQVVTKGIVLARVDFGEADRILTFLSPDEGKLSLLAKGVRRAKSKLAGGIELFSESELSFIRGRGDISTLTSARLIVHYGSIVKDINRTMLGYELLKLINKIVEDRAEAEYYEVLAAALKGLNEPALVAGKTELWFYLHLLQATGHGLEFQQDSSGVKLEAANRYVFDFNAGRFALSPGGSYQANHIKLLRLGSQAVSPEVLTKVQDIDDVLPSCVQLAKTMFQHSNL